MPWPVNKSRPDHQTMNLRVSQKAPFWRDVLRSQLPQTIRFEFVITIQYICLDKPELLIKIRKRGSGIMFDFTTALPANIHNISDLKIPDEITARLCVVV